MNPGFDAFTYITGIAGILGLLLQFRDSFPEHRDIRKTIVLLTVGVFVGSLITSLRGVKADFGMLLTPYAVLIGSIVVVIAIVAIIAAFTTNESHRMGLFAFCGLGAFVLLLILMFGGLSSVESNRAEIERKELTFGELLELSKSAESRGDFDRALRLTEEAKDRLSRDDERRGSLEKRLHDLRTEQMPAK